MLKPTGSIFVNLGDSYAGSGKGIGTDRTQCKEVYTDNDIAKTKWNDTGIPAKSLCGIPERFALAMTDRLGFIRRNTIIWKKRNCMPSSASDRYTIDFEYIYFFTKQGKYWFEQQFEPAGDWGTRYRTNMRGGTEDPKLKHHGLENGNFAETGRNMRTVWDITTKGYREAHFATFPEELPSRCIKAGCPKDGTVLDPFMGSGTTAVVAKKLGRNFIGIDLNPQYVEMANKRLANTAIQDTLGL